MFSSFQSLRVELAGESVLVFLSKLSEANQGRQRGIKLRLILALAIVGIFSVMPSLALDKRTVKKTLLAQQAQQAGPATNSTGPSAGDLRPPITQQSSPVPPASPDSASSNPASDASSGSAKTIPPASSPASSDAADNLGRGKGAPDAPALRGVQTRVTLPGAFDESLMRCPRVAAIRLLLGITKSELYRATEMANPTIFFDNGYRAEDTYRYGITVPIEQPWKLALRIIQAKNQIKQTDLEILKALWIFRAEVRRAYTELIVAQELYDTLSELVELTNKLYTIARKRFEAGEVAELDVYRAEQESEKSLADQAQQEYRVMEAKQALAIILGRTALDDLSVPRLPPAGPNPESAGILPGPAGAIPSLTVCLQKAMENRPELKVVRQAIKTNGASLRLAYSNVLPNPIFGVGSSVVNGPSQIPSQQNILTQNLLYPPNPTDPPEQLARSNFHGFFMQLYQEIPIFNFQQGDISKFRATATQLKAELLGQENLVSSEVATAFQRMTGAKRKIEIYQNKLLTRTVEIARLARLSYEVGQTDINATVLAQQATIQIKTEYLAAVSEYQQAFTDLERSIGTVLQ